jgi:hypothetical protein
MGEFIMARQKRQESRDNLKPVLTTGFDFSAIQPTDPDGSSGLPTSRRHHQSSTPDVQQAITALRLLQENTELTEDQAVPPTRLELEAQLTNGLPAELLSPGRHAEPLQKQKEGAELREDQEIVNARHNDLSQPSSPKQQAQLPREPQEDPALKQKNAEITAATKLQQETLARRVPREKRIIGTVVNMVALVSLAFLTGESNKALLLALTTSFIAGFFHNIFNMWDHQSKGTDFYTPAIPKAVTDLGMDGVFGLVTRNTPAAPELNNLKQIADGYFVKLLQIQKEQIEQALRNGYPAR